MDQLEKDKILASTIKKAPLENGVFVCTDSKGRKYEFVSILNVKIPNTDISIGDYLNSLKEENELLNRKILELCEVVRTINNR